MKISLAITLALSVTFAAVCPATASPVASKHVSGREIALPGIRYRVVASGAADGRQPTRNSAVRVRYEGRLDDSTVFDRSPEEGRIIPVKAMIAGYQAALLKMRVGDEWEVTIPTEMAYGPQGPAPVGGKTLHFRIKLLDVGEMPPAAPPFLSELPR
ncbi:MAG TPA: FKBP-type peptidyl-prolyl cis-trans isomerase [Caulobacteraceae bacterium]